MALTENFRNDPECKFGCKNCAMLQVNAAPYTKDTQAKCDFLGRPDRLYWFRHGTCDYYKEKARELQIAERLGITHQGVHDIKVRAITAIQKKLHPKTAAVQASKVSKK